MIRAPGYEAAAAEADWRAQGRTAEVHGPGRQISDAGISADGAEPIYEAGGWQHVPGPVAQPEAGG